MQFNFLLGCLLVYLFQQVNSSHLQSEGKRTTVVSDGYEDYGGQGPDVPLPFVSGEVQSDVASTHNNKKYTTANNESDGKGTTISDYGNQSPDAPLNTGEVHSDVNHAASTHNNENYITVNYETTETTSESYSRDNLSGYSLEITTEKSSTFEPENDKPNECEDLKHELAEAREYQKNIHVVQNHTNSSLIKVNSELEICKKTENESKRELEFVKSQKDDISSQLQDTQQQLELAKIDLEAEKERTLITVAGLNQTHNISAEQNARKLRHFMNLWSDNRIKLEKSQEEKRQIDAKFKILQQQYEKLVADKEIIEQNLRDSAIQLKTCMDSEKSIMIELNDTKFMLEDALIKEINMTLTIENLTANRDNLITESYDMTVKLFEKEEELNICLSKNHNYSLQSISSLNKENELLNKLKTTEIQNKLSEKNLQITQSDLKKCEDQIQSNKELLDQTRFEIESYLNEFVGYNENEFVADKADFVNYTMEMTKKLVTELNVSVSREQNLSAQIENVTQQYLEALEELEAYSQREDNLNLELKIALQSDNITKEKLESSVQEITELKLKLNETAAQKNMVQSILEENKKKVTEISARLINTNQLLNSTNLELSKSKQIEKKMEEKISNIITNKRNETKALKFCSTQTVRLQSYLTNALQYWNKTEQSLIEAKEKMEKMEKQMQSQQACRDKNLSIAVLNHQIKQTRADITSCQNRVSDLNKQLNDRKDVISDDTHDSKLKSSKLQQSMSNSDHTNSTTTAEHHFICEAKIQEMTSKLKKDMDSCTEYASQMRSEKLRVSHILLDKSMKLEMCIPKKRSNGRNDIYKPARIFSGTYYFNPKRLSWRMARDFCRDRGMDLVSIETAEENEGLKEYIQKIITQNGNRLDNESRLSKPDIAWTSGCYTNEGWTWNSTGNALTFSNWREPITIKQNDARCLLLQASNGAWLNLDPEIALPSLCELANN